MPKKAGKGKKDLLSCCKEESYRWLRMRRPRIEKKTGLRGGVEGECLGFKRGGQGASSLLRWGEGGGGRASSKKRETSLNRLHLGTEGEAEEKPIRPSLKQKRYMAFCASLRPEAQKREDRGKSYPKKEGGGRKGGISDLLPKGGSPLINKNFPEKSARL